MRSKSTDPELRSIDIVKIAAVRQWHSPHNPELYINPVGSTCSRKRRINSSALSVMVLYLVLPLAR